MDAADEIAAVLCGFEEELLTVEVMRDGERLQVLLAEEFREYGSSGYEFTREEIVAALGKEQHEVIRLSRFRAMRLSGKSYLVTYRASRWKEGATVESLRSSVWVKRSAKWQMIFHQGTKVETA